jgi:hypothetical protein
MTNRLSSANQSISTLPRRLAERLQKTVLDVRKCGRQAVLFKYPSDGGFDLARFAERGKELIGHEELEKLLSVTIAHLLGRVTQKPTPSEQC